MITYIEICKQYAAVTDVPLWIKPNAGIPKVDGNCVTYDSTPEEFAASSRALVEAVASFVGGCCGTEPDTIAALKKELSNTP